MESDIEDQEPLFDVRVEYKSFDRKRHYIELFGSWNRFKGGHELEYQGKRIFAATIKLPVGTHMYRFLVDEEKWDTNLFDHKIVVNGIKYNQIEIKPDHPINVTLSTHDQFINSNKKHVQHDSNILSATETEKYFKNDIMITPKQQRIILLISGYTRSIQYLLNKNTILPQSIIILCFRFWYQLDECHINIYCRIRPLLPFEHKKNYVSCIQFDEHDVNKISVVDDKQRLQSFNYFAKIYTSQSTQHDVFDNIGSYLDEMLHGGNLSIFVYGQTGAGKTYTIHGPNDNPGIVIKSMEYILGKTQHSHNIQYTVKCAIIEMYNEKINDLLYNFKEQDFTKYQQTKIRVRHLVDYTIKIEGLNWFKIESVEDLKSLIKTAIRNRNIAITCMGAHSSRSIVLYSFEILGEDQMNDISYLSKLHFVDCAGSERVRKRGAYGQILREGMNIRKSLSALGDVLQAIQRNERFIPYRNSTLTDILVHSVGEKCLNSQVLFYLNVAPAEWNSYETISTLKFGMRISKQYAEKRRTKKISKKRKK